MKITQYESISNIETGDLILVVDVNDTTMAASGTTKNMTFAQLAQAVAVNGLQDYYQTVAGTYAWTIPTGALWLEVMICGAGAGGGSGACGPSGDVVCGGGGGGSGDILMRRFAVADILANATSTLTVLVGAGTAGGTSISSTNIGNNGSADGNQSYLKDSNNVQLCSTYVSGPGSGGTYGASSGTGTGGFSEASWGGNSAGGSASGTGGQGASPNVTYGPAGGGAGGGITTGVAASLGNYGGVWVMLSGDALHGATLGTINSVQPTGVSAAYARGSPLAGGPGGWSSVTGNAAAGTNGAMGSGGGGGGAALNGVGHSGAGGRGGDGFAWIIPHFG